MNTSVIVVSVKGIIEGTRVILDSKKADSTFKELIQEYDTNATNEEIEIAMDNCYYDNMSGLNIVVCTTEIEGQI